ncbi:MAG TPA: hypothetical protein VGC54_12210, partial [Planctomycetota bacterium]
REARTLFSQARARAGILPALALEARLGFAVLDQLGAPGSDSLATLLEDEPRAAAVLPRRIPAAAPAALRALVPASAGD